MYQNCAILLSFDETSNSLNKLSIGASLYAFSKSFKNIFDSSLLPASTCLITC